MEPRRPPSNYLHMISKLNPLSHRRSSSSRHDDDGGEDKLSDDGMQVTMEVAITIALPSPQYPTYIRNREIDRRREARENADRENMIDYCIGVHKCSWS